MSFDKGPDALSIPVVHNIKHLALQAVALDLLEQRGRIHLTELRCKAHTQPAGQPTPG
jgi:hypothetical protein